MRDLLVLNRQALAIQQGMKELSTRPPERYSAPIALFCSLAGFGVTTIMRQVASVQDMFF